MSSNFACDVGHHTFRIEELGKFMRHLVPFIWMKKPTEEFPEFITALKEVMVIKDPRLISSEMFEAFIKATEPSIKRTWNNHGHAQWKHLFNIISGGCNRRIVGGSLDHIDVYHNTIPTIGPERIGGNNDALFSSIFSISNM